MSPFFLGAVCVVAMMFLLVLLHLIMQVLHYACIGLRNKNSLFLQILQEFFELQSVFLHLVHCRKRFLLKMSSLCSNTVARFTQMSTQTLTLRAKPFTIEISERRFRAWQSRSKILRPLRAFRRPRSPAPARTAHPSAGTQKNASAASWRRWAMNQILRLNRPKHFPRPSASSCLPPSGTYMKMPFIWRSSGASGSSATSAVM